MEYFGVLNPSFGHFMLISFQRYNGIPCAGYLGHPFRKLAICTSLIFLSYHFPLVKDMELLREWRTDLWSSLNK
jgi:hypothetical protein